MQMLPLPAAGAGATGDTTMSSTQHQLIEQCATRLRGIVEALDNIHDTSPHRWSTDLDDVHSSAESLLALIKDQAPVRSEASFEEWLANELEGEDGQPVPAAVCDIALARRAFNHWPKLEQPAKVGGVRFSAGVSSRLVVEAAQRLYEFESTPEKEAERPEVVAYRTIGRHEKHQHPHYALNYYKQNAEDQAAHWRERGCEVSEDELMTVAQHERIDAARMSRIAKLEADTGALEWLRNTFKVHQALVEQAGCETIEQLAEQRDAALAEIAELEKKLAMALDAASKGDAARHAACGMEMEIQELKAKLTEIAGDFLPDNSGQAELALDEMRQALHELLAAAPTQAQHSVPEEFIGRLSEFLAQRGATGKALLRELRTMLAAAPGKEGV
ncbi:TPA: hypothetical protein N2A19_000672 [Pseudomonas aeruginosa]|nr:hypothetical protein [Pseudomonas aeruginosa]